MRNKDCPVTGGVCRRDCKDNQGCKLQEAMAPTPGRPPSKGLNRSSRFCWIESVPPIELQPSEGREK